MQPHPKYARALLRGWIGMCICIVVGAQSVHAAEDNLDFASQKLNIVETIMKARSATLDKSGNHMDSAIGLFQQALARSSEIGYYPGEFMALSGIGITHSEQGRHADALHWFRHALAHATYKHFSLENILRTIVNIGDLYLYQGQYEEAVITYLHALYLEEFEFIRNRSATDFLIRTYNSIGATLLYINEHDRALAFLKKGEKLAQKAVFPEQYAHILHNIARVRWKQNRHEEAWHLIHHALTLARDHAPSRVEYTALQAMAEFHIVEGNYEAAISRLYEAMSSSHYINPYYRSVTLFNLGSAYLALGQYPEAHTFLRQGLQEATAVNAKKYILFSFQKLADLYEASHQYKEANAYHKRAYLINDSLLTQQKTEIVSLLELKYKVAEKDKEIIQKQLLISTQQNYLRQKNIWIYIISGGFVLLAFIGYNYYRTFRQRLQINMLNAMIDGEETERKRIGRDLHDGINGQMAAINMHIGAIQKKYESHIIREELEQVMHMMDHTSEDIRRTAHNLIPDTLSRYSFRDAVYLYCEQLSDQQLQIICEAPNDLPRLGKNVELILFRMLQELLHNIVKHAQATQAVISISCIDNELSIVVEDNGKGFDMQARHAGVGLNNIKSRARMLRGEILIESGDKKGSIIVIMLDVHKLNSLFSYEDQNRDH